MSDLDKLAIDKNWLNSLSKYLDPYSILSAVEEVEALRRKGKTIYPPNHLLFNAYNKCSLSNIKIVIFGQDPYPKKDQANGLSFSYDGWIKKISHGDDNSKFSIFSNNILFVQISLKSSIMLLLK